MAAVRLEARQVWPAAFRSRRGENGGIVAVHQITGKKRSSSGSSGILDLLFFWPRPEVEKYLTLPTLCHRKAGKRHVVAARADAGWPGSVTAPPATAEPASQSTAVTPPAAPGSLTSPPHEIAGRRGAGLAIHSGHSPGRAGTPTPAGRGASRHRRPSRSRRRNPPRSSPGRTGERHGTAGHRGAGLAIHRGHSPGRAGKRHVAAARADAGRPGSVTAPPATAFLDAIRDPAHERHAASATFDAAAKRVTAGGGRILGGPLESPGGSKASIRMVRHFALEGKNPF